MRELHGPLRPSFDQGYTCLFPYFLVQEIVNYWCYWSPVLLGWSSDRVILEQKSNGEWWSACSSMPGTHVFFFASWMNVYCPRTWHIMIVKLSHIRLHLVVKEPLGRMEGWLKLNVWVNIYKVAQQETNALILRSISQHATLINNAAPSAAVVAKIKMSDMMILEPIMDRHWQSSYTEFRCVCTKSSNGTRRSVC